MRKKLILGIAASLRNARWGAGNRRLVESIREIETEEELFKFLKVESELHLENFINAGREEGLDFLDIYKNLKRNRGDKGLSNSEVALAAGLWSAHREGADIDHVSLSEYFLPGGGVKREDELAQKLLSAEGIVLSGPVYFGDRGSLAQSLFQFIRSHPELREKLQRRYFAGIAVGAKRNGGQETTLIYQTYDALQLGFLCVGNDSETTSQYGGTGHAGDVGTMHKDSYGLGTSMGVGRRIGRLVKEAKSEGGMLKKPLRVTFFILQDRDSKAMEGVTNLIRLAGDSIEATIVDVTKEKIMRCLACDVCPTNVDVDEVYRCIITSEKDAMSDLHPHFIGSDALVPVIYSPSDMEGVVSNYQTFIERTRYLRRGDYVMSDNVVTPYVIEEVGASSNMALRALTSMVRHHTILSKPLLEYFHDDATINKACIEQDWQEFQDRVKQITLSKLIHAKDLGHSKYNPVGYVLSADKDREDERMARRRKMIDNRKADALSDAEERLG